MKIGIDGYEANVINRVGSGQYAYQLLKQLSEIDLANQYTIFLPSHPLSDMPRESPRWHYISGSHGAFWTMRELPRIIHNNPVDIFFSPTHYAPLFIKIPRIISIMDLSYIHFPQMFRFKDLVQLKIMTRISVQKASAICTISEFSKKEIIDHYHLKSNNIQVTYPGLQSCIKNSSPYTFEKIQPIFESKPYILFVGTIQPRKNIIRLIEAFETLSTDCNLVLVGKKGWLYESIFAKIKNSVKRNAIIYLDFVTNEELSHLYKNARCFVLPSLYEGFGIPVLEAMFMGCPVVVSCTTSLPEVAGNAGIYVDPTDKNSIARGLTQVLQLTSQERLDLTEKGKIQAAKFSWDICAQKVIAVFNRFTHK